MQRVMNLLAVTIFLCGDVMTGRGIDQVLPHPSNPRIYEPYATDAREYVRLAEKTFGPVQNPLGFTAVWGDALAQLDQRAPDVRVINLETALTKSEDHWKGKDINYRMNPANAPVLSAAGLNVNGYYAVFVQRDLRSQFRKTSVRGEERSVRQYRLGISAH